MATMQQDSLGAMLVARADGPDADRVAIVDGSERATFADLVARAAERAGALAAHGVRPGSRVSLRMSAGLPFLETWWGVQLTGATPCAFNPTLSEASFERQSRGLDSVLVVTDDAARELRHPGARVSVADVEPEQLALLQPTSGTSGEPRIAMITQRNIIAMLHATATHVRGEDVMVAWVPPWHDLGLFRFVIGTVYYGAVCHIVEPSVRTIGTWLETVSRVRGTVTAAPDFAFRIASRMVPPDGLDLSSLLFATSGGEPVRRSTIAAFEERFSTPGVVLPAYGLAEATVGVSTALPGEPLVVDERGTVGCGRPLPGVEVRAGTGPDEPGEILVRGEIVFAGYLDAPEDTTAVLRDGWLHTGDTGYVDTEGRLFVLGRRSGMIKRAGATVAPRELEEAAEAVHEVRVAAAVGVESGEADGADEVVALLIEIDPRAHRSEADIVSEISAHVTHRVGFAPHRVTVVPPRSIPRTANGKIRHDTAREELRRRGLG
jgi:fatty-acyl-CoA synthase